MPIRAVIRTIGIPIPKARIRFEFLLSQFFDGSYRQLGAVSIRPPYAAIRVADVKTLVVLDHIRIGEGSILMGSSTFPME
jgi:hypothetical protein